MERRRLGRTELEVTPVGFGAAPLGQEYGELDEAAGQRLVHHALDRGLNLFDVAPYYGRTLAEERLGRALEGHRDRVVLATKCARHGRRDFDFSAAGVRRDLERSLCRLRTDHLDLWQVHDVEFGDPRQVLEETLPTLRAAREAGTVRAIGVTGLHLHLLRELGEAGDVDCVLSYCHHDLLAGDLARDLCPWAREAGVAVLSGSPTHMGILTDAGPQDWHPAPPEVRAAGRALAEACRAHGLALAPVALAHALRTPGPDAILIGPRTPEELDDALSAQDLEVPDDLWAELHRLAAPVLDRTWHEGLPGNAPPSLRAPDADR